MTDTPLPTLTKEQIDNALNDTWDFLFLFIDHYIEFMSDSENQEEAMKEFSSDQHTLLAFNYLYGQVSNGGFIQLVQNGYGAYVFNNPFSKYMREWGAEKTADIVDQANVIYQKEKENLEKETTLEDFSEMYDEYQDFEPLDEKFYEVMDEEAKIVKEYVYKHIENFAILE